jgi:CheY-like chemotaxis protein
MGASGLGFRVLVVEDEPMIAMVVEDTIEMMGYQIVGPVAQLDDALALATCGAFDCAVLDINIRGGNSYAVADLLLKRGCPFLFTTVDFR